MNSKDKLAYHKGLQQRELRYQVWNCYDDKVIIFKQLEYLCQEIYRPKRKIKFGEFKIIKYD